MKKSAAATGATAAAFSGVASAARASDTTPTGPPAGAAPGSTAHDGHVHGPVPGQEPTSDAVSLVESKAMDTRFCLNCKQTGHSLVRCGVTARDYKQLPCALCYGQHWERSCWGPVGMRAAWTVKRDNFFYRADNASRHQRDGGNRGQPGQQQGSGSNGGNTGGDGAGAAPPAGGN
eukprot:3782000-Rhodomonas_salina.1